VQADPRLARPSATRPSGKSGGKENRAPNIVHGQTARSVTPGRYRSARGAMAPPPKPVRCRRRTSRAGASTRGWPPHGAKATLARRCRRENYWYRRHPRGSTSWASQGQGGRPTGRGGVVDRACRREGVRQPRVARAGPLRRSSGRSERPQSRGRSSEGTRRLKYSGGNVAFLRRDIDMIRGPPWTGAGSTCFVFLQKNRRTLRAPRRSCWRAGMLGETMIGPGRGGGGSRVRLGTPKVLTLAPKRRGALPATRGTRGGAEYRPEEYRALSCAAPLRARRNSPRACSNARKASPPCTGSRFGRFARPGWETAITRGWGGVHQAVLRTASTAPADSTRGRDFRLRPGTAPLDKRPGDPLLAVPCAHEAAPRRRGWRIVDEHPHCLRWRARDVAVRARREWLCGKGGRPPQPAKKMPLLGTCGTQSRPGDAVCRVVTGPVCFAGTRPRNARGGARRAAALAFSARDKGESQPGANVVAEAQERGRGVAAARALEALGAYEGTAVEALRARAGSRNRLAAARMPPTGGP